MGKACINMSGKRVNLYNGDKNHFVGYLDVNECYSLFTGSTGSETGVLPVYFRKSNGTIAQGDILPGEGAKGDMQPFANYIYQNGAFKEIAKNDWVDGYEHMVARGPLRWYLGETVQGTLAVGTKIAITNTTGLKHPYRIQLVAIQHNGGWVDATIANPAERAWIDFMTLGTMPNNRSIN